MQTFGEDCRRAEQRRHLAERRIRYGNAASDFNMRSQPVSDVPGASFPNQQPYTQISTRARVSLSNAFSWQLGGVGSLIPKRVPLTKSPAPPKEMHWLPIVAPQGVPRVTWDTEPQYEKLQKRALAKSKLANFLEGKNKSGQ